MRNRRYTVTIGDKTTRLLVPEFIEINGKLAMMPGDEEIIRRAVEKIYGRAAPGGPTRASACTTGRSRSRSRSAWAAATPP